MSENEKAKIYIEKIDGIFSFCSESGTCFPGNHREIEEARELIEKASEINPDDPQIAEQIEQRKKLILEAPKMKWAGSYFIVLVLVFFSI